MSTLTMQIRGATREEFAQVARDHGWEIDPVGRVAQMTERVMESRKLIGLSLSILGLLLLTAIGIVAIAVWGAPWELIAATNTQITALGSAHQGFQSMSDRAPTYQPLPPMGPPYAGPPSPPGAQV